MNYNVYYYYDAPSSRIERAYSYCIFDAQSLDDARQQADNWLRERHGDVHYNIWDCMPSHEFVDEDDYATGF